MKSIRAFTISLFASLLFGAAIFFGLLLLVCGSANNANEPFEVLYGIYIGIQFILSMINHARSGDMKPDQNEPKGNYKNRVLNRLLKVELILYCVVFTVLMAMITGIFFLLQDNRTVMDMAYGILVIISIIFCCSIPYILCCTASVILFYALITREEAQPDAEMVNTDKEVDEQPISDRWPAP